MTTQVPTFASPNSQLPTCPHCHDVHERREYADQHTEGRLRLRCPTCGRQFRPTDRLTVFYELYDVLSRHRRGTHVDKMVTALLRSEQGTRELVGITAEARRALFLNTESRTLVAVQFDKHGVAEAVDETLGREIRDARSWLLGNERMCLWTHPRYQRAD